jgi:hypothetical protein
VACFRAPLRWDARLAEHAHDMIDTCGWGLINTLGRSGISDIRQGSRHFQGRAKGQGFPLRSVQNLEGVQETRPGRAAIARVCRELA